MGVFSGVFGVRWNWMGSYDSTVKQQLFRVETGEADWNVAAITVRAGISTAAKTGEGGGGRGEGPLERAGRGNFTSFDPFSVQLAVLPCSTQAQSSRTITVASKRFERGILSVWKGPSLHATLAAFLLLRRYEPWAQWTKICRTVLESSVPRTTHRTQGSPSSQISGVTRITHQRALGKISQFNKFNLYSQISL